MKNITLILFIALTLGCSTLYTQNYETAHNVLDRDFPNSYIIDEVNYCLTKDQTASV